MRLLNAVREAILTAALRKAFDQRAADRDAALMRFADDLYHHEFGALCQAVNALPKGWIFESSCIEVEGCGIGETRQSVDGTMAMSMTRRLPLSQHGWSSDPVRLAGDHPMAHRAMELVATVHQLKDDRARLTAQLRSLLWSATTREKLLDAWPEAESFWPADVPVVKPNAIIPAELVADVNRQIAGVPDVPVVKPSKAERAAAVRAANAAEVAGRQTVQDDDPEYSDIHERIMKGEW